MNAAEPLPSTTDLERRLRASLADTSLETPRPMVSFELGSGVDKALGNLLRAGLRPAAVLVPIIRRGDELSMLLTVRSPNLRAHSGQIAFPGGAKDASDITAVDNALREAQEEVGLDPHSVEVIGYLEDYPTLSRFLITPVVGIVDGDPDLRIDAGEVAETFEVPFPFVASRGNFERKLLSRDGLVNVPFYELNWQQYRIWGATAGMLWGLAGRIGA